MRSVLRLAGWGFAASVALGFAAAAQSSSEAGVRLASLISGPAAPGPSATPPSQAAAPPPVPSFDAEGEVRRLARLVHNLSEDRDRLATRVVTLENALDSVTGSVTRQNARIASVETAALQPPAPVVSTRSVEVVAPIVAAPPQEPLPPPTAVAAAPEAPAPTVAPPPAATVVPYAAEMAVFAPPPARKPVPAARPAPRAKAAQPKSEFGVVLGSTSSIDEARTLWKAMKSRHGSLTRDLRPVFTLQRDEEKGTPEFRLVAGPLASAEAATKLCAALAETSTACTSTAFKGLRLTSR